MMNSTEELLLRPLKFLQRRSFHLVTGVYFATYTAANVTDTYCYRENIDNKYPKFMTTSITNIFAVVAKDRAFTRMFGLKPPSRLPIGTYALFTVRDCLTNLASFTLPPIVAAELKQYGFKEETSLNLTQLTLPVAIQFVSTPLHLTGSDLYNNPHHSFSQRLNFIGKEYFKSAFARAARIFPAFGIGGVLNREIRDRYSPGGVILFDGRKD